MNLFLSPHCDDETLFGAYIILNEKPLVAILRAENYRMLESIEAMKILGAPICFIDQISDLKELKFNKVYAPALEHGHLRHDFVHNEAKKYWDNVICYSTYRNPSDIQPRGTKKVECTEEMQELKKNALECYKSQIIATPCHFELLDKSEFLV